jgi:hypothetical protein
VRGIKKGRIGFGTAAHHQGRPSEAEVRQDRRCGEGNVEVAPDGATAPSMLIHTLYSPSKGRDTRASEKSAARALAAQGVVREEVTHVGSRQGSRALRRRCLRLREANFERCVDRERRADLGSERREFGKVSGSALLRSLSLSSSGAFVPLPIAIAIANARIYCIIRVFWLHFQGFQRFSQVSEVSVHSTLRRFPEKLT